MEKRIVSVRYGSLIITLVTRLFSVELAFVPFAYYSGILLGIENTLVQVLAFCVSFGALSHKLDNRHSTVAGL